MGLYSYFRVSKPAAEKVPAGDVDATYKHLRNSTFWGVTIAYSIFYVCQFIFPGFIHFNIAPIFTPNTLWNLFKINFSYLHSFSVI